MRFLGPDTLYGKSPPGTPSPAYWTVTGPGGSDPGIFARQRQLAARRPAWQEFFLAPAKILCFNEVATECYASRRLAGVAGFLGSCPAGPSGAAAGRLQCRQQPQQRKIHDRYA